MLFRSGQFAAVLGDDRLPDRAGCRRDSCSVGTIVTRIRDIVVAALMLLVMSPFLLILAVRIRLRNDRVVEEQLRATLLVNPRPTAEAFTKYSFPSKNMGQAVVEVEMRAGVAQSERESSV